MWSRLAKVAGVGTLVTASAVYYRDDLRLLAASTLAEQSTPLSSNARPKYHNSSYDDMFPRLQWERDWDFREPLNLVDQKAYEKANEEERKEMLSKVKSKATRHIFLIRHGQYHLDSEERNLTELGREQAKLVGKRLAESDIKFDHLVKSTMCRATETANIIMEQMPELPHKSDSIIEEGAPYPPEPPLSHWKPAARKFASDGMRIEAAFRKYIHRAKPTQENDSYELIVCHANVIRYFVMRAMQLPPEAWLRMSLANSSITWIVVRPNGYVSVRAIGDAGHLPKGKLTFT